jgi:hypothetical protein
VSLDKEQKERNHKYLDALLNAPPKRGPAIAEQLQVKLRACDHFALSRKGTISEVITHTELTMPPAPMPASAREPISLRNACQSVTQNECRGSTYQYSVILSEIIGNRIGKRTFEDPHNIDPIVKIVIPVNSRHC